MTTTASMPGLPGPPTASTSSSLTEIATLADLRASLQGAIELEHATMPPYLCALYSLDPDRNSEVREILLSVFVEEMTHLALAANLLNAVGGRPRLDTPELLTAYPRPLPHANGSFEVSLLPFGMDALDLFMRIERPSARDVDPESTGDATIGQFYDMIEQGMRTLCARLGETRVFCGDPTRQVSDEGRINVVGDLTTALSALHEIVVQGEGASMDVWDGAQAMFHPQHDEVGHYFRFRAIQLGRCYRRGDTAASGPSGHRISIDWGGVLPMRPNPRSTDHAIGSPIRDAQVEFNLVYCTVLQLLDETFNGRPETLHHAIGAMFRARDQAEALMRLPHEDGLTTAGPTFEYIAPEERITT